MGISEEERRRIEEQESKSASGLVSCRVCIRKIAKDARTCPSCGADRPWRQQSEVDEEHAKIEVQQGKDKAQQEKGKKMWLGCGLVFGGLFLLVIIMTLFSSGGGSGNGSDPGARYASDAKDCARKYQSQDSTTFAISVTLCMKSRGHE